MKVKKLYLISQDINDNYDTFDSAVVVAYSAKLAQKVSPSDWSNEKEWANPKDVTVTYLGIASPKLKVNSVVCSSFNAG